MIPSDIQKILQDRCMICHQSIPGKEWTEETKLRAYAQSLLAKLAEGAMPPGNSTGLTDTERQQLMDYIKTLK